jgi:hypothetical protein
LLLILGGAWTHFKYKRPWMPICLIARSGRAAGLSPLGHDS